MHENEVDSLTGLPDRDRFIDALTESVAYLRPGRASLAVLMIDLDEFASVNESLGREAGDALIHTAARRIVGTLRRGDVAARLGGDEFAVLCERLSTDEAVVDIAPRLLDAISQPVNIGNGEIDMITACIGIAVARSTGPSAADLMVQAQLALRRAKKNGRLRFQIFDPELHHRTRWDPANIKPA